MRIRSLSLLAALLTCSAFAACAPQSDDDDGNGGLPSPSGTATTNPPATSPIPTPTPTPITVRESFVTGDGNELWLCLQTQFDGNLTTAFTDDGGTCTGLAVIEGATESTSEAPSYSTLTLQGSALACSTGAHDWWIDYLVDETDCEAASTGNSWLRSPPAIPSVRSAATRAEPAPS